MYDELLYKNVNVIQALLTFKIRTLEEIPPLIKMSKELNWGFPEAESFLFEYYTKMKHYIEQEFETDGPTTAKTSQTG